MLFVKDALYLGVPPLFITENPLNKPRCSGRLQDLADAGYMTDVGAEVQGKGEPPQDPLS